MARLAASERNTASARTAPTYPRSPMGAVYIKGAKSIEGATGDMAVTEDGWIENQKYGWYCDVFGSSFSAEFDTAITRTGTKTLKLSTLDATGRGNAQVSAGGSLAALLANAVRIKPSTPYILSCWVKTNNTRPDSCNIETIQYDVAGVGGTVSDSSYLTGTNDWTLLTISFTSDADAYYIRLICRNVNVGYISDAWFDVNSMTLVESNISRNPVV